MKAKRNGEKNEEKISVRDDTKCIVNFWKTSIKVMSHYSPQDKTHGEKRQDKGSLYKSLRRCLHGRRVTLLRRGTLLEGSPFSIVFPGFVYMIGRVTLGGG